MTVATGWVAWRERGGPLDAAIAVALLVLDASTGFDMASADAAGRYPFPPVSLGVWLAGSAVLALPLAVRRIWPRTAAAVLLGGIVVTVATHGPATVYHLAFVGLAVLVVTLRLHRGRRAVAVFVAAVAVVLVASIGVVGPWVLGWLFYVAVGVAVGEVAASRRAAQRAGGLVEQQRAGEQAALQERVRIAREMHDVVTHAVSVMVVQAEGARLAVRRDPDRAEQAMGTIADAGRQTLDELRGLVTALRGPEPGPVDAPGTGPVGDLAGLAATMRAAGLGVRLDPDRPALPAGLHATGYRIVQEALTNCLRHAPPGAAVTVGVARDGDRVRIRVVDDGGPQRTVPDEPVARGGLTGMRERARAAGGSFTAGPVPSGGWRVEAELPVPAGGSGGSGA